MKSLRIPLCAALIALIYALGCLTSDDGGDNKGNDNDSAKTTYSVSGRILDTGGSGIADVNVRLAGTADTLSAVTDKEGSFFFGSVSPGTYTLIPAADGKTFAPATRTAAVTDANVSVEAFVGVASEGNGGDDQDGEGHTISGRIVDITGAGIPEVTMSATNLLNRYTAETDANGEFTFTGVADGVYGLVHNKMNYAFIPSFQNISVSGSDVVVDDIIGVTGGSGEGYYIIGRIITPAGMGLADVTLSITNLVNRYETTSNEAGFFMFTGVASGVYGLVHNKMGYTFTPEFQNITVEDDHVMIDVIIATTSGEGSTVSGRIVDPTGAGVADVTLSLTNMVNRYTSETCSLGYFTFENVADGVYGLVHNKMGYTFTPEFQNITVEGENVSIPDIVATTESGGDDNGNGGGGSYTISGRVLNTAGDGFANVQIILGGETDLQGVSDDDGYFTFANLPTGTYMLVAMSPGYMFTPLYHTVSLTDKNVEIEFRQYSESGGDDDETYSISGNVTDKDGNPIGSVSIMVTGKTQMSSSTDSDGNYNVDELPNAFYTVIPDKEGYTFNPPFAQVTVNGTNMTQNFIGTPVSGGGEKLVVSGRVVDKSGNAISDVKVDIVNLTMNMLVGSDKTGYDGRYEFKDLFTGIFLITPSKEDYSFEPSSRQITLTGSSADVEDFVGTRTSGGEGKGDIYGKIVKLYDTKAPVENTRVTLMKTDTKDSVVVKIDTEGVYSFTGVADGKYTVTPHNEFFVFEPRWKEITFSGTQVADVNFKGGHTISGGVYKEIKDDNGEVTDVQGVPGVTITTKRLALDFSEIGFTYAETTTDAFGHYTYDMITLVPGEYNVKPSGDDEYEPPEQDVTIEDRNLVDVDFFVSDDDNGDNDNDDDGGGGSVRQFHLEITNTTTQNLPERNDETVWKGVVDFELEIKEDATFGAITGKGELKVTGGGSSHNDSESCTWTRTGTVTVNVGGSGKIDTDPGDDKVKLMLSINLGMGSKETIVMECIDEEGHKTTTTNEGGGADMPFELYIPAEDGYTISRTITPGGGVTGHVLYILRFGKSAQASGG